MYDLKWVHFGEDVVIVYNILMHQSEFSNFSVKTVVWVVGSCCMQCQLSLIKGAKSLLLNVAMKSTVR